MAPTDLLSAEPETAASPAASPDAPAPQAAAKPTEAAGTPDLLGDPADGSKPAETTAGQGETKPAEDKPAGDSPEYDLKAPEGAPFADGALDEIKAFATEHKLAPDVAQALTDRYAKALTASQESFSTQIDETFKGYADEIRADKTWGGSDANQKQTAAYFAKAMDYAAPGYRQSLRDAKAMLEPPLYFALAKFGKQMSEPGHPEASDTNPSREQSYAESFPNTPKNLGGSKKE